MFLTISIQTYNHAETLAKTLESLRAIRCPENVNYEILVINNNSSDHTAEVVRRYDKLLPQGLRSVQETAQGLSHSRNRALYESRGQIVCFLDDDVIVEAGWLEAVSSAFRKYSATVVGGRSYLIYPSERPAWLPLKLEALLSRVDYGDQRLVNTDKELFGLNFSVLRKSALEIGGFDTRLGRCGRSLICGEEKDLIDRIRKIGGTIVYEPAAIVGHIVPPERLTKKWFLRRIYAGAVSSERLLIANGESANLADLFSSTFRCWGSVVKGMFTPSISSQDFFERQFFAVSNLGRLVENIRHKLRKFKPFHKNWLCLCRR